MNMWTALVVIVAIWAFVQMYAYRRDRHRHDGSAPMPLGSVREDPAALREIEDLRERIKVLERIATDGNSLDASETRRIANEIEALRDRQNG